MRKKPIYRNTSTCTANFISKATLLFVVFAFSFSCKKAFIDNQLLFNPSDTINSLRTDTFQIETYTVNDVPIIASGSPRVLLGKMDDATFGQSTAGVYAPFTISTSNVVFGGTTLDSIVLQLNYTATYGPLTKSINLKVYEMNEGLVSGVNYNSDENFDIVSPPVGSSSFVPDLSSEVYIDGDTLPPVIRIKLDNSLGEKILNADSLDLQNADVFNYLFKGLFITADQSMPGDGVVYVNPASAYNSLILYYDGNKKYELKKLSSTRWISHYNHYNTGYPLGEAIQNHVSGSDSILYLQSMIGSRLRVKVLGLENVKDLLVNKAELVFTEISPFIDSTYTPPAGLYVYRIQDDASSARIKDDYIDGLTHLDGNARLIEGSTLYEYRINVTRYVQDIIDGDFSNHGLYIHTRPYFSIADRAIFAGGNHSKYRTRLILHYTSISN